MENKKHKSRLHCGICLLLLSLPAMQWPSEQEGEQSRESDRLKGLTFSMVARLCAAMSSCCLDLCAAASVCACSTFVSLSLGEVSGKSGLPSTTSQCTTSNKDNHKSVHKLA